MFVLETNLPERLCLQVSYAANGQPIGDLYTHPELQTANLRSKITKLRLGLRATLWKAFNVTRPQGVSQWEVFKSKLKHHSRVNLCALSWCCLWLLCQWDVPSKCIASSGMLSAVEQLLELSPLELPLNWRWNAASFGGWPNDYSALSPSDTCAHRTCT